MESIFSLLGPNNALGIQEMVLYISLDTIKDIQQQLTPDFPGQFSTVHI